MQPTSKAVCLLIGIIGLASFGNQPARAQQKAAGGAPPQGIDALTAPIALYPDALIAQVLDASTNPAEVQDFGAWLKQNSSLKGSEVQEAASKAGFDAAFIALALFPDVIDMMAQKPDWTKQLGDAFKADAKAVSDSIQACQLGGTDPKQAAEQASGQIDSFLAGYSGAPLL